MQASQQPLPPRQQQQQPVLQQQQQQQQPPPQQQQQPPAGGTPSKAVRPAMSVLLMQHAPPAPHHIRNAERCVLLTRGGGAMSTAALFATTAHVHLISPHASQQLDPTALQHPRLLTAHAATAACFFAGTVAKPVGKRRRLV